jgi:hypothetical protein
MCEEPFGPIMEMHGVLPIGSTDRGSLVSSMSTAEFIAIHLPYRQQFFWVVR